LEGYRTRVGRLRDKLALDAANVIVRGRGSTFLLFLWGSRWPSVSFARQSGYWRYARAGVRVPDATFGGPWRPAYIKEESLKDHVE